MPDLARAKGVNALRLTLLAPDIVEAILDGRQPEGLRLKDKIDAVPQRHDTLRRNFPRRRSGRLTTGRS